MLEMTEFPYLPAGNPAQSVAAMIQLCREMPMDGEQFRFFRRRVKGFRLWDDDRVQGTLDFLGLERKGTMKPSRFVRTLRGQKNDEKVRDMLADRLWEVNPLLFKSVLDRLGEQVHSRDELIKHVHSFAYPGKAPVRPQLESWLTLALGLELLKMVGIALDLGPKSDRFVDRARALDVEDILEEVAAREGTAATGDADAGADEGADEDEDQGEDENTGAAGSDDGQAAATSAASAGAQTAGRAPGGAEKRGPRAPMDASQLASPRGRERPVNTARFVGESVFDQEVLAETTTRIQAWWTEQSYTSMSATADDFGLDANSWMEGAEEALYRVAVAAALVFRLDRDRDAVLAAFQGLDQAGVLSDLYYGTAPDELPENVDPKALMLASLVARRCAEAPELANSLDQQKTAAEAFAVLDAALGRGFLRVELFWMMRSLFELGALRQEDLPGFTSLPHRLVRDTLFRLGFIASPYAHDAESLIPAAQAARRAAGTADAPDEVLMGFALAAGCAYDCGNRKSCEYACRERADS